MQSLNMTLKDAVELAEFSAIKRVKQTDCSIEKC